MDSTNSMEIALSSVLKSDNTTVIRMSQDTHSALFAELGQKYILPLVNSGAEYKGVPIQIDNELKLNEFKVD